MQDSEFETDIELPKSKSQIKRELLALQDLGKSLLELSSKQLDTMPLADKTRDAIKEAHHMKKGALKRQLKYIGGLMKTEDDEKIMRALELLRQPSKEQAKRLHKIESWRDTLIAGDEQLGNDLANQFDDYDRQHVRQLVRNAVRERDNAKPPKSARLLFKYLSALLPENNA